ncbi:MAG: prolyl-tRNA synthetase associated domain-containing protein [Alphaproteobacteria bacterium]|nr:prolyl-tRNA synthetase associated domain-containing protein [Alphaproteobacteria bacterium]
MPCTTEQLYSFLDRLGIEYQTTEHPPIFSAEDGRDWDGKIPGRTCKNLFLKDARGDFWLVVMPADKRAHLDGISRRVGAARYSFAKPELLAEVLETTPGSVSPFALLNDKDKRVRLVLDEELLACDQMNCHPLHNAASTTLRIPDFLKFIEALGYVPVVTECGQQEAGAHG